MNGLRIRGAGAKRLERLMAPIAEQLRSLYWLFDADFRQVAPDGSTFDAWEEAYDILILEEWPGARLAVPGFFPEYAKFVVGDWTDILGIRGMPVVEPRASVYLPDVVPESEVYFKCVDGAFWEVYSPRVELLAQVGEAFPLSRAVQLREAR